MAQLCLVSPHDLDLRFRRLHRPLEPVIEKMAASLKSKGQISPLIAADDVDGPLVLLDGFKRQAAAEVLGWDRLKVMKEERSGSGAKAMIYLANRRNDFSMIQEALLLRELVEVDGLMQVEAAVLLERHKSWVSRRLDMIRRLSDGIVDDLQLGLLPPGSGPALARLPPCNQADFSAAIQVNRLLSKEINKLVDLWVKAGDPSHRRFLLDFPREALEIAWRKGKDHAHPKVVNWRKDLSTIRRLASGFERDLTGPIKMDKETALELQQLLDRTENACRSGFNALRNLLSKEISS